MDRNLRPALTPELWAEVFAHIQDCQVPTELRSWHAIQSCRQPQQLLNLRLVCKQSDEIIASNRQLLCRLSVHKEYPSSSLLSLLRWLQSGRHSLDSFEATCGSPMVDAVLAGLVSNSSRLTLINIWNISQCSISLAAAFTSLEKLCLINFQSDLLDLTPLQVLPQLKGLSLEGNFCGLNKLAHLSALHGRNGVMHCSDDCSCTATLQELDLIHCVLKGFHCQGLAAYRSLKHLVLSSSSIWDQDGDQQLFARDLSVAPDGMSALTQLDVLHVSPCTDTDMAANLYWISELTSLQDLSLSVGLRCSDLETFVPTLKQLTRLSITGLEPQSSSRVNMDMQWSKLQELRFLGVSNCLIELGLGVADLLHLDNLTDICFEEYALTDVNTGSSAVLAALAFQLAQVRPHIRLVL